MIKIECKCTHKVLLPDSLAGRQVRCPRCKRPIDVPGEAVEYQLPRAPKAAAAAEPAAPARRQTQPPPPPLPPPPPPGPEDELAAVAGDRSRGYRESWHRRVHFKKSNPSHTAVVVALALVFLAAVIGIIVVVAMNRPPVVPEVITVKDVKVLPGPGGAPSPNGRIGVFGTKKPKADEDSLTLMKEFNAVLETVVDEPTARAAKPRLDELASIMWRLHLERVAREEPVNLSEEYKQALDAEGIPLAEHRGRLGQLPELWEIVGDAVGKFYAATSSVKI